MMMVPTSAHTNNPPYSFTLETPRNPKTERREQYFQNQMYQIQQELNDLQGIVHNLSSGTGNRDTEITRDTDMTRVLEQMESMRAEIDWLRRHQASDWAQGLSDEPPPGYGQ